MFVAEGVADFPRMAARVASLRSLRIAGDIAGSFEIGGAGEDEGGGIGAGDDDLAVARGEFAALGFDQEAGFKADDADS